MLKSIYEKKEDIPEGFESLFTEKNGKWELTGIAGMKTQADIDRIQEGLTKERNDHKETKAKLAPWDGLDHEETLANLDKIEEYKLAAGDKLDEDKINEMVESRIVSRLAPHERKIVDLEKANGDLVGINGEFKKTENRRTIEDAVRKANSESQVKIIDGAMDDVLMNAHNMLEITEDGRIITRDKVGVMPMNDVNGWLGEMIEKRAHWVPGSGGGGGDGDKGGGGGLGDNPYTRENWNKTKQAQYFRAHGAEKANKAAALAGTTVGGQRPPAPVAN